MIIRCPSCSSRRDLPSLDVMSGATLVDCAACGHDWIEGASLPPVLDVRATALVPVAPLTEPDTQLLLDVARRSRSAFKAQRRTRHLRMGGWASLALLAFAPFFGAAVYPEQVVSALPSTISAYDWMGLGVNLYGLEIRDVDLQHLIVDGRKVIAVKGEVANVSSTARKIPWLRFGLRSTNNAELYHWTLDTEVRPLKPGESTSFVTRLASPPEAARNLEIRFARAEEIGSNNPP